MRRFRLVTAAALLAFAGGNAASAAEFTLFIYETPADIALRTDPSSPGQAYWAAYGGFAKALEEARVIRGGAPLQPPSAGKVVSAAEGETAVSDGAYASTELVLGGYFKIDVADEAAALAWAGKAPAAVRGGKVEVRPSFAAPKM